jgi:DNA-binding NarL/FixJ family response regulator
MPIRNTLNFDPWEIAPQICTALQFEVLELREKHGCTWSQISYMLNRDQATVRGHHRAALRKLHNYRELHKPGNEATL